MMAAMGAAAACAPSRPEPPSPVQVTPPPPRVDTPSARDAPLPLVSGTFAYAPGEYRYEVVTESEIRQAGDSTTANVRTVASLRMRVERMPGDSLRVSMAIDSVSAERDSLVPPPDSAAEGGISAVPTFATVSDVHGRAAVGALDPRGECAPAESLLGTARDLLVPVPDELVVGARWADTSTVLICRGGVPVTTGVVRSYEVLGSRRDGDGMPLMRIARSTAFSLAGTGTTEHRQIVALTGRGESRTVIELDLTAGIVRSATGEATSEVLVTYGRTSTPFAQRMVRTVRRID